MYPNSRLVPVAHKALVRNVGNTHGMSARGKTWPYYLPLPRPSYAACSPLPWCCITRIALERCTILTVLVFVPEVIDGDVYVVHKCKMKFCKMLQRR